MTEQEFDNLEWQFNSHLSTQDYHSTIDKCKTIPNLYRCTKVNYKDGEPSKRGGYTHYMLDDKVYKSKQKLLEAINDDKRSNILRHHLRPLRKVTYQRKRNVLSR